MSSLDSDVACALVHEAVAAHREHDLPAVLSLASTCRAIRHAALAVLFASVRWPHQNKHDDDAGLHFFPPALWPYFRRFQLVWPEDWPEATPPRWGDRYYVGGDYNPRHIDKLVAALPAMPALESFYLSCPFYPPNSLLGALIRCRALRDLAIDETPLSISMAPRVPREFYLDRLAIVPVGEAVRVGDGPVCSRYAERAYYVREYRKKYKNDVLARRATTAFVFDVGKPAHLRHVQLSADLCALRALAEHRWPCLGTLVLTGHAPRGAPGEVLDVLAGMPALRELRLLFAKVKGEPGLRVLPEDPPAHPAVLAQLTHLAVSNACCLEGVFRYTTGLERLAVLAIIDLPRVPIALGRADVERVVRDLAVGCRAGPGRLRGMRIMVEDKVGPEMCAAIARCCRGLEALEIELCGYHDGKSIHAWEEFSDALAPMGALRELRICIQFPEFDEADPYEPWRNARMECARFLAGRLASLRRVGLEFRKRVGTHRFEDSWLEFEVERDAGARVVALRERGPTWYMFPEVWVPVSVPA
ncbi:hypothetical protein C0993_009356 [Termitomyces sp. T159_Od127]|nr:hypothetical protein C0993_009356 [Termitomyces sp. T159_Od127]